MTKLPTTLTLVLVVQLGLAAALYWAGTSEVKEEEPLLAALERVDKLLISDADQKTTLSRSNNEWTIEQLDNLPADAARITEALDRVGDVSLGFPVTTTSSAHERFEVADDDHQRHLEIYADNDTLGSVFLGSSPGFRQLHLRRDGEDEVYAVEMNVYDYPSDPEQWLDKQLLAIDAITQIEGEDYTLQLKDEKWTLSSGEDVNIETVEDLVSAIGGLRINGTGEPLSGEELKEVEVIVTRDGEPVMFKFQSAGADYRVSRSDLGSVFSLSQYEFGRIAELGLADIRVDKVSEASGEEDYGSSVLDKLMPDLQSEETDFPQVPLAPADG